MKKYLVAAAITLLSLGMSYSQNVVRDGDTFKSVKSVSRDTLETSLKWEDSKGNVYPIVVNRPNGRCYVIKKSSKTGKMYRQYLNEEVSRAVCKETGITYIPKKEAK